MISFDSRMRTIHDHLYSSANIRVPEDLQLEVAKVIQTLAWLSAVADTELLTKEEVPLAHSGDLTVSSRVGRELRSLFTAYNQQIRRYPREQATLRLDDKSLAFIVAELLELDMSDVTRDWLGDALEVFRSTAAKRLGGQFFTDQRVTSLAIELLEYDPSADDLVDICAGTGGFLLAGARAAQKSGVSDPKPLIGIEIDSSLAHLANSTLTHLSNFPSDVVFNADSFRSPSQWPLALRKTVVPGTHRRLASNPPFGQKITIKDPTVLQRFDLGHVWTKKGKRWVKTKRTSPTSPDILLLERNVQLAIPGEGRIAIVLPYQILSGPNLGYVREWILRHCRLTAVVDLPEETFQPWTGTKTALLVLEKREHPLEEWEPEDYDIFMAVAKQIGHDRRGNLVLDENGRVVSDLDEVSLAFHAFRNNETNFQDLHSDSFTVNAENITVDNDLRINAAFNRPRLNRILEHLQSSVDSDVFTVRKLGEVVESIFFPGRFKREYVDSHEDGVRFLGGTNVTQLLPTNPKYLSKSFKRLKQVQVKPGWVLITRSGSTGIISSVPEAWDGWAVSDHVIRIIPSEDGVPGEYIEAFLRSSLGTSLLNQGIFGSVIDEISPEYISELPIPIPKDPDHLEKISDQIGQANAHRQAAIALFNSASDSFEELIGRQILAVGEDAFAALSSQDVIDNGHEFIER